MENKKRALGRGLEQLFNTDNLDLEQIEKQIYDTATTEEIKEISLDELRVNPYQPRQIFDEEALNELASSIKEHGVFQPIIVKKSVKGYEIIAGERRFRASKLAGKTTIPAIVRAFTDEQMMEIALLENLQRENLNVMEEAKAYKQMIDKLDLTQEELAKKVGKSRSHITNILGLLRLPEEVTTLIEKKELSMGHARVLSKLEDKNEVIRIAQKVVDESLPVREIERLTEGNTYEKKVKIERKKKNNDYRYVEELLTEKLDTRVRIKEHKIDEDSKDDVLRPIEPNFDEHKRPPKHEKGKQKIKR